MWPYRPPLMAGKIAISAPSVMGVSRPPVHRQHSVPTKTLTWGRTSPCSVSTRSRTPGASPHNESSASPSDGGSFATATWIRLDRKSTRLNSSHLVISYAVFCLKKKKKTKYFTFKQKRKKFKYLHSR